MAIVYQLSFSQWIVVDSKGRPGFCCEGLLQLLFREYRGIQGSRPDILVIHLGCNDLGIVKGKALIFQAREDFTTIT